MGKRYKHFLRFNRAELRDNIDGFLAAVVVTGGLWLMIYTILDLMGGE